MITSHVDLKTDQALVNVRKQFIECRKRIDILRSKHDGHPQMLGLIDLISDSVNNHLRNLAEDTRNPGLMSEGKLGMYQQCAKNAVASVDSIVN